MVEKPQKIIKNIFVKNWAAAGDCITLRGSSWNYVSVNVTHLEQTDSVMGFVGGSIFIRIC